MIGMMMLTFILFFAFVVNTGMLVNAKINLQNAADLAAYAGAATQARQLTNISYLNYEMRRQFKKFLFRYYVIGNMAQAKFPRSPGNKSAHLWSPDGDPAHDYQVPAVCVLFDSNVAANDNYCQLAVLPNIQIPAHNPIDQINETLIQQLQAIENIRQSNCGQIGDANLTVLLLWLFNVDPSLTHLTANVTNPNEANILRVTRAISYGLGLVPRELILRQRINTLAGYVNEPAQKNVTHDSISGFEQSQDPASKERTIQAFLSAYDTLGNWTFDSSTIHMDELLPGSSDAANLLKLQDVKTQFDTYAVQYLLGGNPSAASRPCVPQLMPYTVKNLPVGVAKDPQTLTYYAVRLTATAKVMFSPFGDMQMKAYAAARPFGSRIGPPVGYAQTQWGYEASPSGTFANIPIGSGTVGILPNLPIAKNAKPSQDSGWNTDFVLGSMYQAMLGAPGASGALDAQDFMKGMQAAMAPNPIEGNIYNIVNDSVNDPFIRNFDALHETSFWAPIVPPDKVSTAKDVLQTALAQIFQSPTQANPISGSNAGEQQLQASILQEILNYVDNLQSGQGEQIVQGVTEGMNIAHLADPFTGVDGKPLSSVLPSSIIMTDPKEYRTSWVSQLDQQNITSMERVGYSVKFISFDSLLNSRTTSNGSVTPTNTTSFVDDQADQDVKAIKH